MTKPEEGGEELISGSGTSMCKGPEAATCSVVRVPEKAHETTVVSGGGAVAGGTGRGDEQVLQGLWGSGEKTENFVLSQGRCMDSS